MDGRIKYLNTDLDLTSPSPLSELAAVLDSGGVRSLYVTHADTGLWYAVFETSEQYTEPEPNIKAMLDVIESISAPRHSVWDGCVKREFNIGYDCGNEPWAFNQGMSNELIRRIASASATLRFTLYPNRETAW